jgi:hypothetical protein
MVKIHAAMHKDLGVSVPNLHSGLDFHMIKINDDCNIDIGEVIYQVLKLIGGV